MYEVILFLGFAIFAAAAGLAAWRSWYGFYPRKDRLMLIREERELIQLWRGLFPNLTRRKANRIWAVILWIVAVGCFITGIVFLLHL